jgi:hypothetical protein
MHRPTALFKILLVMPLALSVVQAPAAHADAVAYFIIRR